jgi:hypothetical protein
MGASMSYRWALASCVILFGIAVRADDAGPSTGVTALVHQLSSADFRTREAAARQIEQLGESALPALRQAQPHPDPEVRNRLTQLIGRMERTGLLTPKLVTIKAEQMTVNNVFKELTAQTGYRLSTMQGGEQLVSLRVENMPFWQVIDLICQQTGLGLQQHYDSNSAILHFARVGRFSPHVIYAGPFRLSGLSFHHSTTLDLTMPQQLNPVQRPRTESLTFMFQVVGEPKVPLMSLGQVRLDVAVDDKGNSLVTPIGRYYEAAYHHYYSGYRNPILQTQVQLNGHGTAPALRQLKGSVPVTFLAEQRPEIVINDILNVKNQKFEGNQVSIEIDEVKEQGKQVTIRATARRGGTENQHDYSWTNSLAQRVELHDAKGEKYQSMGFNWDNGTPASVSGTFQFSDAGNAKLGKPAKLVYYNWVMSQHQIEFEFKDLPLP